LKTLILNTNQLRTLPKSIVKLKNLEVLDLSINKDLVIIQHLDKLKQLPKLKVLKIVDVKMTKQEANILKAALSPDTKVIVSIPEYFKISR
jgi:Leucine-rich repeat (LRR) protein